MKTRVNIPAQSSLVDTAGVVVERRTEGEGLPWVLRAPREGGDGTYADDVWRTGLSDEDAYLLRDQLPERPADPEPAPGPVVVSEQRPVPDGWTLIEGQQFNVGPIVNGGSLKRWYRGCDVGSPQLVTRGADQATQTRDVVFDRCRASSLWLRSCRSIRLYDTDVTGPGGAVYDLCQIINEGADGLQTEDIVIEGGSWSENYWDGKTLRDGKVPHIDGIQVGSVRNLTIRGTVFRAIGQQVLFFRHWTGTISDVLLEGLDVQQPIRGYYGLRISGDKDASAPSRIVTRDCRLSYAIDKSALAAGCTVEGISEPLPAQA